MKYWGIFDRVEEKRDAMQSLLLPPPAQQAYAKAALTYRFGEEQQPMTASQILTPRRYEDRQDDLWSVFNRCQENLLKGEGGRDVLPEANAATPARLKAQTATLSSTGRSG